MKIFFTHTAVLSVVLALSACSFGSSDNSRAASANDGTEQNTELSAKESEGNNDANLSAEEQIRREREKYGLPEEGEMPNETNLYFKKSDESEYLQLHIFHDSDDAPVCHLYAWNGTVFKSNMPMEEDQLHWYFKWHFDNGYDILCVVMKDWTSICHHGTMYNFLATKQEYQKYCTWASKPGNHVELRPPTVTTSTTTSSAYDDDDDYDNTTHSTRTKPTYRDRKVYRPNMTGDDDRAWCEQCQAWDMPHGHYRERSN